MTPTLYNYSSTTVTPALGNNTGVAIEQHNYLNRIDIYTTLNPTLTGAYTPYTGPVYLVNAGINNPNSPFDRYDWNISVPWLNVWATKPNNLANGTDLQALPIILAANPDASQAFTVLSNFLR